MNVVELRRKADSLRAHLKTIFDEAGSELNMDNVKSLDGDSAAKVAYIRAKNAELDDVSKQLEAALEVEAAAKRVRGMDEFKQPAVQDAPKKSFGELIVSGASYAAWRKGESRTETVEIDFKTLMSTGGGFAPQAIRTGDIVLDAQRPVEVLQLIPQFPTSQNAVVYMEETTFTNNAAETAESADGNLATWGEAALAFTERTSPVRKIAVFIPVSDEQLEDVDFLSAYLDQRLSFMLRQRLDSQVLVGNGSAPNLRGILNVSGVQTQALGSDTKPDAAYKALVKARVTGRSNPNAYIFHPNDWQDIRLLKTTDGIYIWGSPSESGPQRLWGLPVLETTAITENTALVGDFANYCYLAPRRDIDVQVGYVGNNFVNGVKTIRADMRAAFVVSRPEAFCTVTGL